MKTHELIFVSVLVIAGVLYAYLLFLESKEYEKVNDFTNKCVESGGWVNKTQVGFTKFSYHCVKNSK